MENASKALIIAGAILISILIVGLGVIIYNNVSGIASDTSGIDQTAVSAHNSPIESYFGSYVSGSNVRALINYVNGINRTAAANGEEIGNYIYITGSGITSGSGSSGTISASDIRTGRTYDVHLGGSEDYSDDEQAGSTYWKNGYIKTIEISYSDDNSGSGN